MIKKYRGFHWIDTPFFTLFLATVIFTSWLLACEDPSGESIENTQISAPDSFTAIPDASTGTITLNWTASVQASSYQLYKSTKDSGYATLATTTSLSYTDSGLVPDTTYWYMLLAKDNTGKTSTGLKATMTLNGFPPPSILTKKSSTTTSITIEWPKIPGTGGYKVYRSSDDQSYSQVGDTATNQYTDNSLMPAISYWYKVSAYNGSVGGLLSPPHQFSTSPAFSNVTQVQGGHEQSLALRNDGSVWSWGANWLLGTTNNYQDATKPRQVTILSNAVSICSAYNNNAAILSNGTLWTWGWNSAGQIGDGTVGSDHSTPKQILSNVHQVSIGFEFMVALKTDGTVWVWGANNCGQLGLGDYNNRSIPTQIISLSSDNIAVSAGNNYAIVLKTNGTLWAWGDNQSGQLGKGSFDAGSPNPSQVPGLLNVIRIAIVGLSSFSVTADGSLWCWGENWTGQFGDGTNNNSATPIQNPYISQVVDIAGNASHTLVLHQNGTVWVSGQNDYGQLGLGDTIARNVFTQIPGLSDISKIGAGLNHSFAISASNGTVWAWGSNNRGQLGDQSFIDRNTPVPVVQP